MLRACTLVCNLSTNATTTESDEQVTSWGHSSLAPGESAWRSHTFVVPESLPLGSYYLGALVDPWSERDESDETNNWLSQPIEIVRSPKAARLHFADSRRDERRMWGDR